MHTTALNALFNLPRPQKRALQVVADVVLITFSFVVAMVLRTESLAFLSERASWLALATVVPVSLFVFVRLGFYRAVIRFMGMRAAITIVEGVGASALVLLVAAYLFDMAIPPAVPFTYALLAFCTVGGVRIGFRALYLRSQSRLKTRVIIYGAGQSGRQLLSSLLQGSDYAPVAFVDDAVELQGTQIGGMTVFSPLQLERLIDEYSAAVILLAIPSASIATRAAILARLEHLSVRVQTIPGVTDIVQGRARISEIREVTVEDLLGRDPVPPSTPLMRANITGKAVLVSGAGGSIGAELCRQILRQQPRTLVLLELSEFALYRISDELAALARAENLAVEVVPLLGSVRETERMTGLLRQFGVHTIYHAAAYKHVTIVEQNMVEGVQNNVFGTLSLARAAVATGVESFILISTDKAVRPANVMGATKRLAELVCQALAGGPGRTRFSMVRFGNVLGSSGSVIPRFRAQIAAGGPVTVTDPEVARYFMTITEAAQLVIQAGAMARGGDVFVLDMGQPVRIVDLAQRMIRLSGFTPVIESEGTERAPGTVAIRFTELRPGEKMYEELLIDPTARPTIHSRILTATETAVAWDRLAPVLDNLAEACRTVDLPRLRAVLMQSPAGYRPRNAIQDLTWDEPAAAPAPVAADLPGPAPRRDRPAAAPAPAAQAAAPVLLGSAGS
jgi:FlaA1/EpsC-like NDP-sugar epimerase